MVERWQERGRIPNKDRFFTLSLECMLEEYAGLSVIRSWTEAPEVYPGDYFAADFLARHNRIAPEIDMTIPAVLPVRFGARRQAAA